MPRRVFPICTVVIGPPTAGKSTWVRSVAEHGDLIVDLDLLVAALSTVEDGHVKPSDLVVTAALNARRSAVKVALSNMGPRRAYVVHAMPTVHELYNYRALHRAEIKVVDPGRDVVAKRLSELPARYTAGAMQWYDVLLPAYQAKQLVDP